ncbi:IS110 family transposase [Ideonella livida]|uniref:IS110 family transposase n=1 Tax=Ideonella livida TaxID=2707176 RepID=A0A7C9PKW3_9BURK|nr:IS110 family transposase [Ideonella livida]NDY93912.1 IS110 family transposase [Ideonella livida]
MARVGVDLAKRVFQVHAVDARGERVLARSFAPEKFFAWAAGLPAGCVVAMETCGGAHHVARQLQRLGLEARLVAGHFVAPYRLEGRGAKNDANDAKAICEAAGRPHMRFVPVKSMDQQAVLAVHRLRQGLVEERTACINRIRGLLTEFGLVFPQDPLHLRPSLAEITGERQAGQGLPDLLRLVLQRLHLQWLELEVHLAWCDERIAQHARQDAQARQALSVPGVGALTASAMAVGVVDFHQFRSAHQFGAWLGLVPKQDSSGGKARLGRITKAGDEYLRMLLIQGAKSVLMHAAARTDRTSRWVHALRERVGWQKALVALAHKNARILWALLTSGELYRAEHVSTPPHTSGSLQATSMPATAAA